MRRDKNHEGDELCRVILLLFLSFFVTQLILFTLIMATLHCFFTNQKHTGRLGIHFLTYKL